MLFSRLGDRKPFDSSVFTKFARSGIFGKWKEIVYCNTPRPAHHPLLLDVKPVHKHDFDSIWVEWFRVQCSGLKNLKPRVLNGSCLHLDLDYKVVPPNRLCGAFRILIKILSKVHRL
jgi:hypothetical protein